MNHLAPHECRVLGVLIEKAQTTPAQYPMTLNALVNGCNQKNNREPVMALSEDDVLRAVDGLRAKSFVREVMLSGSRVEKFKHVAREALDVDTSQLVVLAELLLRGPQTVGEIRGRASRMHPLDSTEIVNNILDSLTQRDSPLVTRHPARSGSRAALYGQLLCPDLHPINASSGDAHVSAPSSPSATLPSSSAAITTNDRLESLEAEVAMLRAAITRLAEDIGADDPIQRQPPGSTP